MKLAIGSLLMPLTSALAFEFSSQGAANGRSGLVGATAAPIAGRHGSLEGATFQLAFTL